MNSEYSLNNVNYHSDKCHARQWRNDRSPYYQCQSKQFKDNLCNRCFKKQENNLLWTGSIIENPPENPICITASGKESKKRWDFTKGIRENNDHYINKPIVPKDNKPIVPKDNKPIVPKDNKPILTLDDEFDFEELQRVSDMIKLKQKKSNKDHGGAPFSGLLDDSDDYDFEDYEDITIDGVEYKLNKHDNKIIDIKDVITENDTDKIHIVGIWDDKLQKIR
jgi:hypothetical protein